MLNGLKNEYIKAELSKKGLNDKSVDRIISMFWDLDAYNSIIAIDPVFKTLVEYVEEKQDFTRHEFYSYLVNKETKGYSEELVDLLRKIAVSMESLQRNELDTSDLIELFKQFGISDKKLIDSFFSSDLILVSKEKKVSFFHHSIQEFLATQYIEGHSNSIEYFKKLVLLEIKGLTAFKTSWFNVIRFLLEGKLAQEVIKVILDIAQADHTNVNEQFVDSVVSIDPRIISEEQQKALFDLIFGVYLKKSIWLPTWASKNLWRIVWPDSIQRIKDLFDQEIVEIKQAVNIGNAIPIIDGILRHKPEYIDDRSYWRSKLIQFAHEEKGYGVVQRRAFDALENFIGEIEVLEQIQDVMDISKDKLVRDALVDSASTILPNSNITIDLIEKAYLKGNSIYARYGIYKITEKEALDYLLKKLIANDKFRAKFIDDSSIFRSEEDGQEYKFIRDLAIFSKDKDTLILLEELFKKAYQSPDKYYYARGSEFLPQIAKIINQNDFNFVFHLIKEVKSENKEDPIKGLWDFGGVLPYFFTVDNAAKLASAIKEVDPTKVYFLEKVIYGLRNEKIENGKQIFDLLEANGFIDTSRIQDNQEEQKEDFYQKFLKKLEPEKGKFSLDVFQYYLSNREYLEKIITPDDRERLKDLIIHTVLEKWDTSKIEVSIQAKNDQGGTGQYTITSYAQPYGDAIQAAVFLLSKEEIEPFRMSLIRFIPFAYHDEREAILKLLDVVKNREFNALSKIYLDKSVDKRYFVPDSYIYFVERLTKKGCKLSSARNVLISFLDDERIENYIKLMAIETLEQFITKADKPLINSIFSKLHQNDNDHLKKVGEFANKILIEKFKNEEAIKWRLEQIIERAKPVHIPEGGHSVSPMEDELHSLSFAAPIITLANAKYVPQVLRLLDSSFEIIQKSDENSKADYQNYVNYIWQIVIGFFEFLSKKKNIKPFLKLQKHYSTKKYNDNWFQFKLDALRNVFINAVGTPSISDIKEQIDG